MLDEEDRIQAEKDIWNPDVTNLVIARLQTMPDSKLWIKEIQEKTERGREIVSLQMMYLRSFRDLFFIEISSDF